MTTEFCQLQLTCKDKAEADKIADALLVKHLVACTRQVTAKSSFHWQGKIQQSEETILMMESRTDLFEEIEKAVTRLHSYDTFVLEALPIRRVSSKAAEWLKKELV